MSGVGLLVAVTLVGVVGVLVAISGLLQPAPSLERTVAHLQRPADTDRGATTGSRWTQPIASIV